MLFRKVNEEGIWVDEVWLDHVPTLTQIVIETQEVLNEETQELEIMEVETEQPVLDEEGNPVPDPHYVSTPIPNDIHAEMGLCPQWNGTEWVENVPRPEPNEVPHEPTLQEQVTQLQEENQTLRETVDGIFTEVLPSIFGM